MSQLASFLYELMRDEVVPGVVEKIVRDVSKEDAEIHCCNGWLGGYAEDLAQRLLAPMSTTKTLADFNIDLEKEQLRIRQEMLHIARQQHGGQEEMEHGPLPLRSRPPAASAPDQARP